MEGIHRQRLLGLFSSPPGNLSSAPSSGAGVELDEDDVLWTAGDASSPSSPDRSSIKTGTMVTSSPRTFRRFADKNFGILAALPEEDPAVLRRTGSPLSVSSSSSPSSSARMNIPVAPPRPSIGEKMTIVQPQSAPVNVPLAKVKPRRGVWGPVDDDDGDGGTLPPHEMVAQKNSPMTTFSVLEGAGRTLKGRDLRQVRNAVWRQTGFID